MTIPLSGAGPLFCLAAFILCYIAVLSEEMIRLRKSKPIMLGAGIIWIAIALIAPRHGIGPEAVNAALSHALEEYAELLLFLLAAMAFVSALEERLVFEALRNWLMRKGLRPRQLFWFVAGLAFLLSTVCNNLTTALVVGSIAVALADGDRKFASLMCVAIVNGANAGGVISPFGDVTTLMVWESGHLAFLDFFRLTVPALVCFFVPTAIMSLAVGTERGPAVQPDVPVRMKKGAGAILAMALASIGLSVFFRQGLGLPPYMGMMMGLAVMMMSAWVIRNRGGEEEFDIMKLMAGTEWDTLLFFFGIIFCVAGLDFLGYVDAATNGLYSASSDSIANIGLGFLSAIVDNIPILFAVLSMSHELNDFHWLLITLTTGVGGSMLSIGSAAGIALMGVAHGDYTFRSHLKWSPVLLLGFALAVGAHYLVNGGMGGG